MYCVYCGSQNPDDFRFCYSCGKPKAEGLTSATPTLSTANHVSDLAQTRQLLLAGARQYDEEGGKNPFQSLDVDLFNKATALLQNLTKAEVDELVWPNKFSEQEKRSCSDNPFVYLIYLNMLMTVADTYGTAILLQGAFWGKTMVQYMSSLEAAAEEKRWQDYDEITDEYLEGARQTKAAICLVRPLVKAAHAKLMVNDKRAARAYLDEFDRITNGALRERTAYPFPVSDGDVNVDVWGRKYQNDARDLRRRL